MEEEHAATASVSARANAPAMASMHWLPCSIACDGPARLSEGFSDRIQGVFSLCVIVSAEWVIGVRGTRCK